MRRKIEYRVENETGVGWSDKAGKPYAVFTTAAIVGTLREARKLARLARRVRPLYEARIVRDERRETVVETFKPNTGLHRPEPSAGSGTVRGLVGASESGPKKD